MQEVKRKENQLLQVKILRRKESTGLRLGYLKEGCCTMQKTDLCRFCRKINYQIDRPFPLFSSIVSSTFFLLSSFLYSYLSPIFSKSLVSSDQAIIYYTQQCHFLMEIKLNYMKKCSHQIKHTL